jgi:hypothetical protein
MQRLTSAIAGAAVALAMMAGSSSAQTIQPMPAVWTGNGTADILLVGGRDWRPHHRWRRHAFRHRHDDDDFPFGSFGFGFALGSGFGYPYYGYPYSYAYRPVRPACPYGSYYDPDYGCVVASYGYARPDRYDYYPLNRGPGGLPLDYRENKDY